MSNKIRNKITEIVDDFLQDRKLGGNSFRWLNWETFFTPATCGYRNRQRILYSNDGLIFASYDHYHTFYEITQ